MNIARISELVERYARTEFPNAKIVREETQSSVKPAPMVVRISDVQNSSVKLARGSVSRIVRHLSSIGVQTQNGIIDQESTAEFERMFTVMNGEIPIARIFTRFRMAEALLTLHISAPPIVVQN